MGIEEASEMCFSIEYDAWATMHNKELTTDKNKSLHDCVCVCVDERRRESVGLAGMQWAGWRMGIEAG